MSDDSKRTLVEEWTRRLKNNRWVAGAVLFGVAVVGLSQFVDSWAGLVRAVRPDQGGLEAMQVKELEQSVAAASAPARAVATIPLAHSTNVQVGATLAVFDLADNCYYKPGDFFVGPPLAILAADGWTTSEGHWDAAGIAGMLEYKLKRGDIAGAASYASQAELPLTPSDVAGGNHLREVFQKDVQQGLLELKRRLHPRFTVVLQNSADDLVVLRSVDVRLWAVAWDQGSAGDVPTGGIVRSAGTVVVEIPIGQLDCDFPNWQLKPCPLPGRLARPFVRTVAVEPMAVPAHGLLRLEVIVTLGQPHGHAGVYSVDLGFFLSNGRVLRTDEFSLGLGD